MRDEKTLLFLKFNSLDSEVKEMIEIKKNTEHKTSAA